MARDEDEIPYSDDPERQVRIGSFLIQSRMLEKMEDGIFGDEQLHYCDAAERAGIPFEIALLKVTEDGFWRDWFLKSKDRPRKKKTLQTEILPPSRNLLEMKKDAVAMWWEAGLFHKAADMITKIDHDTPEGGDRLINMLRVARDFFPKEATQKVIQRDVTAVDASKEELEKKLAGLLEQNMELQEKARQGEAARRALAQQGETDGGEAERSS